MAYSSGNKVSPAGASRDPGAGGIDTPLGPSIRVGVGSPKQAWGGSDQQAAAEGDDFDGGKVPPKSRCCSKCAIWTSVSLVLLVLAAAGVAVWYVACINPRLKLCVSSSTCEYSVPHAP